MAGGGGGWYPGKFLHQVVEKEQEEENVFDRVRSEWLTPNTPITEQVMRIEVNPGRTYIDTADWSRDHEKQLEDAISRAVFQLGYPGRKVVVRVTY